MTTILTIDRTDPSDVWTLLRRIEETSGLAGWIWDGATDAVVLSPPARRLVGAARSVAEMPATDLLNAIQGQDRAAALTVFAQGGPFALDLRIVRLDGSPGLVRVAGRGWLAQDGGVSHIIGTVADCQQDRHQQEVLTAAERSMISLLDSANQLALTGPRTPHITHTGDPSAGPVPGQSRHLDPDPARKAFRVSQALFEDIFDQAPGGMLLAEVSAHHPGLLARVNRAMTRITGYSERQLLSMTISDLTHPSERPAHLARFAELADGPRTSSSAVRRWVRADGREIWVQLNVSPVADPGAPFLIGMVEDITDRTRADAAAAHRRLHDDVTGLPNRALLVDRLEHALDAKRRSGNDVAVLLIDLVDFHSVNDVFGRSVGDQLLMVASRRMQAATRPGDTVARTGSKEFVVLCPNITGGATAAQGLADRLVSAVNGPFQHAGVVHHVNASIGARLADGDSAEQIVRSAAEAILAARQRHRSSLPSFCGDIAVLGTSEATRHVRIENELSHALDHDELVMYGQPVVNLATGAAVAVEMLIRWQHPTRGLLGPDQFLDVAEQSPLMKRIGDRVLHESCRIAAGWKTEPGTAPLDVFVNISGRQLADRTLPAAVLDAVDETGLAPGRLVLELTETSAPLIDEHLLDDLDTLRGAGVRLAIDDVGTGYSSLSRLTELPIDVLKIDRSFVAKIGRRDSCDAVVRAILDISKRLELQVIAEGVETEAEAAALRERGCTNAQGYLFSRPLPEGELQRWLIS